MKNKRGTTREVEGKGKREEKKRERKSNTGVNVTKVHHLHV
jgi:hypothetical protein